MRTYIVVCLVLFGIVDINCHLKIGSSKIINHRIYRIQGLVFWDFIIEDELLFMRNPKILINENRTFNLMEKHFLFEAFKICSDSSYFRAYQDLNNEELSTDLFELFQINDSLDMRFISNDNLYMSDSGIIKAAYIVEFDGVILNDLCSDFIHNHLNLHMLVNSCEYYSEVIAPPIVVFDHIINRRSLSLSQIETYNLTLMPLGNSRLGFCD